MHSVTHFLMGVQCFIVVCSVFVVACKVLLVFLVNLLLRTLCLNYFIIILCLRAVFYCGM